MSIGTPTRSPSKRKELIDSLITCTRLPSLSPARTPNGRAGLRSPEKRSVVDLDMSARKKAHYTLYDKLMNDELDSDDFLDKQDRALAESIIRSSRKESIEEDSYRNYGSDVELELDLTTVTRKGRRIQKRYLEDDLDDDDTFVSDSEVSHEEKEEDSEREESEPEEAYSRKDKSRSNIRQKRGRRQNVAEKVKSIFHQDDELFDRNYPVSVEPTPPLPPLPPVAQKVAKKSFANLLISQYSDRTRVPIVSGLNVKKGDKSGGKEKFEPLPVPKLDSNGHIDDGLYLERYFNGRDPSRVNQERLLDEKVFSMEGPEGYFEQLHRRFRINSKSLIAAAPRVSEAEFNNAIQQSERICQNQKDKLFNLHKKLYNQWCFELSQNYNLIFYGVGSKLSVLNDFAEDYFGSWWDAIYGGLPPKALIVNGFNPNVDFKAIALQIASVLLPEEENKFPKHVSETVPFLVDQMEKNRVPVSIGEILRPKLLLVVHNLDGEAFRTDKIQGLFAQLMGIPEVWVLSSIDHINAPLLWDSSKAKSMNLIWHDLTTYHTYSVETSFKDVLSMGKSKQYIGSLGAKFVLRSLTDNHRQLYKILLTDQLSNMENIASGKGLGLKGTVKFGVDLKALYNQCLDEFIVSNEVTFRTFLKEYVDHKMCQLVKDSSGLEKTFIPFTFGEMQDLQKEEFEY
ncbi:ORC2 [Candida theae]|uniref:Origin recognition complex subunit 2 n=1 Tax=Candida theae TaxID=1198502 RepID=A0AAD5BJ66_9ASCO|nr:ORC2 [Candida theae]KAI5967781.1 ORC2 [Candida theae]